MEETTSREQMLKKIRNALIYKTKEDILADWEKPLFNLPEEDFTISFAKSFVDNGGQFIYCENKAFFKANIKALFEHYGLKSVFCRSAKIIKELDGLAVDVISKTEQFDKSEAFLYTPEKLIAHNGSILVSSLENPPSAFFSNKMMITVAFPKQILRSLKEAMEELKELKDKVMPEYICSLNADTVEYISGMKGKKAPGNPSNRFVFLIDE